MDLYKEIVKVYPELTSADFNPENGAIHLRDDSDGVGPYIAKWEYAKPLPSGFNLGK